MNPMTGFLIFALVSGMFGGIGISKIFGKFGGNKNVTVVETKKTDRFEKFRDRAKGIEYELRESNVEAVPVKASFGTRVGNFIDKLGFWFLIICGVLFFVAPTTLFAIIGGIISRLKKSLSITKTALKQTVKGIDKIKTKVNGETETIKQELEKAQDAQTRKIISDIKND